jgi:uncharacterized protein (TIRG00374 family)
MLIMSMRWSGLLLAQGVRASLPHLIQSCVVAGFARQFLPSTIGGDAVRGYDSWRIGAGKSVAITTLVVDRLMGFLALVSFAVVALFIPNELSRDNPLILLAVSMGAVLLLFATWLVFVPTPRLIALASWSIGKAPRRSGSLLEKVLAASTAYQGKTGPLVRALLLSFLLQANVVTFYYLIGRAMGFAIPYHAFYLIVPIAAIVMLLPISINAIGIRENVFVYLLGSFAVNGSDAVAFAWIEHGLFLFYGLVGGVVYAVRKPHRMTAPTAVNAERTR